MLLPGLRRASRLPLQEGAPAPDYRCTGHAGAPSARPFSVGIAAVLRDAVMGLVVGVGHRVVSVHGPV